MPDNTPKVASDDSHHVPPKNQRPPQDRTETWLPTLLDTLIWLLKIFCHYQARERLRKTTDILQDCRGVLGGGDVASEYDQKQVEVLEGFNEMDTLMDRGFLPKMLKEE